MKESNNISPTRLREAHFRYPSHFDGRLPSASKIYQKGGDEIAEAIAGFEILGAASSL